MTHSQNVRSIPTMSLNWTGRVRHQLRVHGIYTLGQLADLRQREVFRWENIAAVSVKEMEKQLWAHGLDFRFGPKPEKEPEPEPGEPTKWQRQRDRWVEMRSAWERVPEQEQLDPDCVEFRAENLHFALLMGTAATMPAEIAEKIELATARDGGWEPTAKWWLEVVEDLRDLDRRLSGTPLQLETLHAPPSKAEYTERITKGVMDAIIVASQVEDGTTGRKVANIDGGAVIEVLIGVMSLLFCQSAECSTPQRARVASNEIARRLRLRALAARERGLSIELHQLPKVN